MKNVSLILFIATLVLCRALPAAESGGEVVSSGNPFDLGTTTACRRPATNVCSMIDYKVPASIAALTEIIEREIAGKLDNPLFGRYPSCVGELKEVMCAFRFPRCEGTTNVVMKSAQNCTQKISSCPQAYRRVIEAEGLCQLNATLPLDSCAPLSESQVQFHRCSVIDASTSVTAWMLEYMKLTDAEWNKKLNQSDVLSSLRSRPVCSNNLMKYFCGFYGECIGNGRLEIKNSEGFCNDMTSCYPDETANSLRTTIDCELWPLESERPSPPLDVTQPPTSPPSASTSKTSRQQPIWPSPPTVGSGASLQVTGTLLLLSLVLSIFVLR